MQNNQNILYTQSKLKIEETEEWKFLVFDDTKMWPYSHLFHKDNTLYDDEKNFRWWKKFPFQPQNGMTEIFLATEKIIIACWQRKNIKWVTKSFVDIITADKLKYRIELDEVVLVYDSMIDNKKSLVINYGIKWEYKTITLTIDDLKIQQTKEETIVCEFNFINNQQTLIYKQEWYFDLFDRKMSFDPNDYLKNYFVSKNINDIWYLYLEKMINPETTKFSPLTALYISSIIGFIITCLIVEFDFSIFLEYYFQISFWLFFLIISINNKNNNEMKTKQEEEKNNIISINNLNIYQNIKDFLKNKTNKDIEIIWKTKNYQRYNEILKNKVLYFKETLKNS